MNILVRRAVPAAAMILAASVAARAADGDAADDNAMVATEIPAAPAVKPALPNEPWVLREKHVRLEGAETIVVRSGPGESFAVVEVVPEGSGFLVIAKREGWYNVRLSDERTAWVHSSLCHEYDDLSGLEFRPNPRLFSRIGTFTLTGYTGGYSFDRKSNSLTAGGRFGYYVLDMVEVEGGVAWTHVDRPAEIVENLFGLSLESERFHMLFYEMNANVHLLPGRALVPYATLGVGSTIARGETENAFNYGGGIRFYVSRRAALRWEFRTYRFESGSDRARRMNSNYTFTIGTTVLL